MATDSLVQDFFEAEKEKQKLDLLLPEIASCKKIIGRLKSQISGFEKEIILLIASGEADTEEEFRSRALVYEERNMLIKSINIVYLLMIDLLTSIFRIIIYMP